MPADQAIKTSTVQALSAWADLAMERRRARALAETLPEFRARIERLNAVDTAGFEFDFLRPLEIER